MSASHVPREQEKRNLLAVAENPTEENVVTETNMAGGIGSSKVAKKKMLQPF